MKTLMVLIVAALLSGCGKIQIPGIVVEQPPQAPSTGDRAVPPERQDPCKGDDVPEYGCTVEDFCRAAEVDEGFVPKRGEGRPEKYQIVNQDTGLRPVGGTELAYLVASISDTREGFMGGIYVAGLLDIPIEGGPTPRVAHNYSFSQAPAEVRAVVREMVCSTIWVEDNR